MNEHADRDRTEPPNFEAMLHDAVGQYDPRSEVLATIVDWTNAPSSTMSGSPGTSRSVAARATPAQVVAAGDAISEHQHDKAIQRLGGWTCRCGKFVVDSADLWSHIERAVADAVVAEGGAASSATGGGSRDGAADTVPTPAVIDAAHLERQRAWSRETFGPHQRVAGVLDHIRKELLELDAEPDDVTEWADIVILALDGAWRAGHQPQQIIDAIVAKQARNEARSWPDWRTADPNRAIEHVAEG